MLSPISERVLSLVLIHLHLNESILDQGIKPLLIQQLTQLIFTKLLQIRIRIRRTRVMPEKRRDAPWAADSPA
ncbi:hypothetical protein DF219_00470 [Corynebacterium liangguodongii]|nr:hypothetical protein DF219_00470 [Corynebacterium liangguodongii]